MRWVRVLAIFAVVIAAGVVVAIVALGSIDWSQYQRPIVEAVESATGRQLAIEGELRLRIGWVPAVRVDGVTFSNAGWGTRPQMATLEHFDVRLRLLPLLAGRIEVGRVELRGLNLLLETRADGEGEGNWVFAPSADAGAERETPPDAPPSAGEAPGTAPASDGSGEADPKSIQALIEEALVEDLTLVYRNGATGESQEVHIEQLRLRQRGSEAPLAVELRGRLGEAAIELEASLQGALDVPSGAPLGVDLDLRAGGATVKVTGRIGEPLAPRGIDLNVSASGESLAALSQLAGSSLPGLGPYALSATISDDEGAFLARDLALRMGSSTLTGTLRADVSGDRPRIDLQLQSPKLDLADFEADEPDAPAPRAAEPGASTAPSEPEPEPEPAASGAAAPNAAPDGDGGTNAEAGDAVSERVFSREPLPLDGLSAADAVVALDAAQLLANGITLSDVKLRAQLMNGVLQLRPLSVGLSGGSIELIAALDASQAKPRLRTDLRIRQVDVGALLKTLDATDVLSGGALDLDLDVSGMGRSLHRIMTTLEGRFHAELDSGRIENEWARLVLSDMGTLLAKNAKSGSAELNCILADFELNEGVAETDRLVVDTTGVAIFGAGDVDLGQETLDLRFEPLPKGAGASLVTPPVRVKGSLLAPETKIDKDALGGKAADLISDLARGKSIDVDKIKTKPGVEGCLQLLAARAGETDGKPESGTASLEAEAQDELKKQKKKLKKRQKKLVGDAVDQLEGLLGR